MNSAKNDFSRKTVFLIVGNNFNSPAAPKDELQFQKKYFRFNQPTQKATSPHSADKDFKTPENVYFRPIMPSLVQIPRLDFWAPVAPEHISQFQNNFKW